MSAGNYSLGGGHYDSVVFRTRPDGSADETFGNARTLRAIAKLITELEELRKK